MNCKQCGSVMYAEKKGSGFTLFKCTNVNCGNTLNYLREGIEPDPQMINPANFSTGDLLKKVTTGEIGLNQIPLPDRLTIKNTLEK